jgi:hypothetical protein
MPVIATGVERKMRGGAQAHLLAAGDGRYYVTKFIENPQHRRVLINERICESLLKKLGVATPESAIVELSAEFVDSHEELSLSLGTRKERVRPGWALGSRFPGNPHKDAVYDYLPDSLLPQVVNLDHFLGALVFDKWTSNSDSRQAIYFRRPIREWLPEADPPANRKAFIACMVDQGYAFDGPHWRFSDSPAQGLYMRPMVYERVRRMDDLEPWLTRVVEFPEDEVDRAGAIVTPRWWDGDDDEMNRLLETLVRRRGRVPDLILETIRARPAFFPNWGRSGGASEGRDG